MAVRQWTVALVVAVGVTAGGFSSDPPHGTLRYVADGGSVAFGIFTPGIGTQPLQPLCVSNRDRVTITSVTPRVTHGTVRLVDWGLRVRSPRDPYDPSPIGAHQSVASLHEGFTHATFSSPCSGLPTHWVEVLVSVQGTGSYADGFWIDYRSGGQSLRMLNPTMVRFKT